jgi:hypothetical protein
MHNPNKVSSFVRFEEHESLERDYYIAHTSLKRFNSQAVLAIIMGFFVYIIPGIILLLYFALRRLKISHGYAAVTNRRVIYYEFNDHPEENYQHIRSLHLEDITGIQLRIDRSLLRKSFAMIVWTEKKAIQVGAMGFLGIFRFFGSTKTLEPGPDALQFVQDVSGHIAARRFAPDSDSRVITS